MNSRIYRRAMAHVKFDAEFEERMINTLQDATQKRRRYKVRRLVYAGIGMAACAAAAVFMMLPLKDAASEAVKLPIVMDAAASPAQEAAAPTVSDQPREVVKSSSYGADLACYISPEPGQIIMTNPVQKALDNQNNAEFLFFVSINMLTPEQYANTANAFVYNGRSILEWSEMVDLSNGEYPYNEYNGDHGGDVTVEQWEMAQEEAKKADAQKNRDEAMIEYEKNIVPMLDEAKDQREAAEIERLSQLGYHVFMYESWTYVNEGEKERQPIFAALLTKDQLLDFDADKSAGYFIDWVHNGDGVVDWKTHGQ